MGKRLAVEVKASDLGKLPTGSHAVGVVPGLMLQVTLTGTRSWVLRMMVAGRRRDMGLGAWPGVPLADARRLARDARESASKGVDPIAARKASQRAAAAAAAPAWTFDRCAAAYIAAHRAGWRNGKHAEQWTATLGAYASPTVGALPVAEVGTAHVRAILMPIWNTKTETATRVRGRIEAVLDWSVAAGHRPEGLNPARWKGHLALMLPPPRKVTKVEHHTALPWADMPALWPRLVAADGMGAVALRFLILCASRSGEVRGATWAEFDMPGRGWTVPGSRMKAGKPHRVPLADEALGLLAALPPGKPGDLVFPGTTRGKPLSDMTLGAVLRRMQVAAVPHGFRSTFRDWCAECTTHPRAVVETALAHAAGDSKVEAAYLRTDLFDKRRPLMSEWAKFIVSGA